MSGKRGPSDSSFGADERGGSLQVQVIRDEHQLSRSEVRVDASGCVRHHERADAELGPAHERRTRPDRQARPRTGARDPPSRRPARLAACRVRGRRRVRSRSPRATPECPSTRSSTRSSRPSYEAARARFRARARPSAREASAGGRGPRPRRGSSGALRDPLVVQRHDELDGVLRLIGPRASPRSRRGRSARPSSISSRTQSSISSQ
jgi:hypothetical protein